MLKEADRGSRGNKPYLIRIAFWSVWILALISDITSGALRYVLQQIGAVGFIYLPKILVVGLAVVGLIAIRQNRVVLALAVGHVVFSLLALLYGLAPLQVAFGLTIFAPLIFGALFWPYVRSEPGRFIRLAALALLLTCGGLLWNLLGAVPWAGLEYTFGDVQVEGAREWSTFGFTRPSGFARLSAAAAIHVMVLTLLVCPTIALKSRYMAAMLGLSGLVFVALTTTKAAIAAMLIMLGLSSIRLFKLHRYVLGLVVALSVFVPFSTGHLKYVVNYDDPISTALLASFDERLNVVWPEGLRLLSERSIPGLGRGLGGVGSGERYFGTGSGAAGVSVTDNYALYLYGNFGLFGLLFLFLQLIASIRLIESDEPMRRGLGLALGGLLIFGFSTDSIEALLSGMLIGIALRAGYRK